MDHRFSAGTTSRRLRRLWAGALVSLLVLGMFSSSEAQAERRRPLSGEFVAAQPPVAGYMATDNCDLGLGEAARFPFKAPDDGLFTASMSDFVGDWDIWLLDEDGEWLAGSYNSQGLVGPQPGEKLGAPLRKGQKVELYACNFDGQPEVTVRWKFEFSSFPELLGGSLLTERVPVNYVFVGYGREQVDAGEFEQILPHESRPVIRSRGWYGTPEGLGIQFTFDHKVHYASSAYEDRFFERLKKLGNKMTPTFYQTQYTAQETNAMDITENLEIDALAVERWLQENPPEGVDTTENTVFFVNWFGRSDFRPHVYAVNEAVDPDTGYAFGRADSAKMIAWGGSPHQGSGAVGRVWFHDLSAGPDWRTGNWQVDSPPGYIMPPTWEYSKKGMRAPSRLADDLGKVARYVAIDLFFAASPIYPVAITPSTLPDEIDLDLNLYEGDTRTQAGKTLLNQKLIRNELQELQPLNRFSTDVQQREFFEQKQLECYGPHVAAYQAWPLFAGPSCYSDLPYGSYSNLFLYNAMNLDQTRDDEGVDYEATGALYTLPAADAAPPYLGLADDNHRDGTQSFIYVALPRDYMRYYGMSAVTVHEYGHHFGMSHMHDGFDYQKQREFGPYGRDYYVWVGDEVSSTMSYMHLVHHFSQFERDNMARYLTGAYALESRRIAQRIIAASEGDVSALLDTADAKLGAAREAFAAHRYQEAASAAKQAYVWMLGAARTAGIRLPVDRSGTTPEQPASKEMEARIKGYYSEPIHQYPQPWLKQS